MISSKIALEAEKIAYNLSFGTPWEYSELQQEIFDAPINFLKEEGNLLDCLKKMDEKIASYLTGYNQKNNSYNDPGYDIHHSLGSYHSIVGRLLLYVGKTEGELKSACERFLKATYYFHRIGLSRKVERNLTLAGRAKVRSGAKDYAEQCIALSDSLLSENISMVNAPKNENFEFSMQSRLNSLQGEYNLTILNKHEKSLEYSLKALRGSLWVGSNRQIPDNLYIISQCARNLENREIQIDIKNIFPKLWDSPDKERIYDKFIHTPESNVIAKGVIDGLIDMCSPQSKFKYWKDAEKHLKHLSAKIWNESYRKATKDEKGEHPFASKIEEGTFLNSVND